MRSEGHVRFIKISSRLQIGVAGAALALGIGLAGSMGAMAWNQYRAEADLASFHTEKARVASAEERLEAYGGDLDRVIDELDERQQFLDAMAQMLPDDIRDTSGTVTDSSEETAKTVDRVGAVFPQARGLAEIEARQLAVVEKLTRFAEARARKAEAALRKLDLDPTAMARNAERSEGAANRGMGGPLEQLTTGNGPIDPRFERLGLSLSRMAALERALDGIPQVVPASIARITSGFGYRRDPFNRRGAMHWGIDFGGEHGSPIFAAAKGHVTFAGWKSGYGNLVEITHATGLMTRYAHMSRLDVKRGEEVEAGATLGGLGSTGRSTGPHLHFEVRLNNRAVNPRPFLETAPDVLKEARGTVALRRIPESGE
ncbi:M23 family metallopeptidase [Erythrobacter sp. HL-111]|uniref:M23 family metallopeptidase n=1 Tax=Erythrobacter sp. HL-111 TaxID=1798193 RepID=UPI0006DACDF7|nr:M23 family metallopeptidase [Erythrobacter sp. HL-111]KPP95499.1 MAG: Peptidase, M23/M37 family [Erythrobacteraceae bacterium HL-111]SDS73567.1 Murein DD-endopeptidase MepM and murein hydrolase activator NlpD, contain LysM domain [Erythrobacter sp. HL-111]